MFALLFPLFLCLDAAIIEEKSYQIYILEKSCASGSLNVSLTDSGSSSSGILKATSKTSYSLEMKCSVLLSAPPRHLVVVSFKEMGFRRNMFGICKDYIEVEGEPICETIHSEDEERPYWSSTNVMKLIYYTSPDGLNNKTLSENPGFTLVFTALSKATEKNCTKDFLCGNGYCIWSGLRCDGHNNCGDRSDEDAYGNSNCGRSGKGSTVLIVLAVLIIFALLLICGTTLLCTNNEMVRRFSTRLRSRTLSFIPKIR